MLTRFGIWYLATLAPAVALFWLSRLSAPLNPTLHDIVAGAISVGIFPILAVIATSFMLAFGIDTDRWLPAWYRRLFGLPVS
ncbi:MAG: hypothetical protein AB7R90_08285 [Reyranellaceae bacterium]